MLDFLLGNEKWLGGTLPFCYRGIPLVNTLDFLLGNEVTLSWIP